MASSQHAFSSSVTFHIRLPLCIEPARVYIYTYTHTHQFAYSTTPNSSLYVTNIYLRPSELCYNVFPYLCHSWRSLNSKQVSLKPDTIIKNRWKLRRSDIAYLTLFNKLSSWQRKLSISCFSLHSMLQTDSYKSAICYLTSWCKSFLQDYLCMVTEVPPLMERNWWSLCSENSVRTPPTDKDSHPVSLTPILIILCNLKLGILRWLICLGFPIKHLCAFLSLRVRVTCSF